MCIYNFRFCEDQVYLNICFLTPEINNKTHHGSISKRTAEERNSNDYRKLKQQKGLETYVPPKGIAINHM